MHFLAQFKYTEEHLFSTWAISRHLTHLLRVLVWQCGPIYFIFIPHSSCSLHSKCISLFSYDLPSVCVSVLSTPSPSAPSNVALVNVKTRNETHIELEWTKVDNINTYILKSSDETETPITGSDGSTAVTHIVSSLSAGTSNSFTLFTVFEEVRSAGYDFSAVTGMSLFLIAKFQGSCFFSLQHLKTCVS